MINCGTSINSRGNRLAKATEHLPSRGQTIFTTVLYSISALMVISFKMEKPNIEIFLNQIKFGFKVPLAAYQPSAVSLYWMTSGAMAVLLNLLLMEPRLQLVTALIWGWKFLAGFVAWSGSHSWSKSPKDPTINWERIFTKQLELKPNKCIALLCLLEAAQYSKAMRQCARSGSRRTTPGRRLRVDEVKEEKGKRIQPICDQK